MSGTPYTASEDSALLRRSLRGFKGGVCLEIGSGNSGNIMDLLERFDLVVGTDLVRPSMTDWRGTRANVVLTDAASSLRDCAFDLVAFNPPYLRGGVDDGATDGGEGMEVPGRFLAEALRVVKPAGKIVFLVNTDSDADAMGRACAEKGFRLELVDSMRVFFEELRVYSASRAD